MARKKKYSWEKTGLIWNLKQAWGSSEAEPRKAAKKATAAKGRRRSQR